MGTSWVRVLLVDDSEPWRNFFLSALQKQPELQVIGRASDGLEAVQQAQELAQFIKAALRIEHVVVVIASESLHTNVLQKLRTLGVGLLAGAERAPLFLDISDPQSTSALYEAVKAQRREGLHVAVG